MNDKQDLQEQIDHLNDRLARIEAKFGTLSDDFTRLRHELNTLEESTIEVLEGIRDDD